MNILAPNEIPIWLFVTFVAMFCLILSVYLTYHRKKAEMQSIVGQSQRFPRQKALVLGTSHQPHLALLTFCPACGKQADTLGRTTHSCGFCGQNMVRMSRCQTRRFSTRKIDIVQ